MSSPIAMDCSVSIGQIDARVGDLRRNLDHHLEVAEKARQGGAAIVVFPELSLTGYTLRDIAWEVAVNPFKDDLLSPLRDASRGITIVFGMVESGADHGIYNAGVVLEEGRIRHVHRKIYPPTYGMFEEGRYFSRGNEVAAFDLKLGRFGLLICEDLWHLSLPYLLACDGAETIISLTASPSRVGSESADLDTARVNHEQHRAYARLLSSYIVFSNRVGYEDGVNFWGGSAVVEPGGSMVATAKLFEEDLISARLTSLAVERSRRFSRHFLDEDPELVRKTLKRIGSRRHLPNSETPT
jgi:NAD+ synthase (glutamine-hydrolysing)